MRLKAKEKHFKKRRGIWPLLFFCADSRKLVFSFLLFFISLTYVSATWSGASSLLMAAFCAIIITYACAYGTFVRTKSGFSSKVSTASFYASILLFLLLTSIAISSSQLSIRYLFLAINTAGYAIMFLFLFFILQLFFYTKNPKARFAIILAAFLITAVYFAFATIKYVADDEMVIAYYSIVALLHGINPYTISISKALYSLEISTNLPLTVTTGNTIVGVLDYPALYVLVQIPFYLLTNVTLQSLQHSFMHLEAFVFFGLFLISYMFVAGKKRYTGPDFLAYIALGFAITTLSSIVIFLMMAIVLALYSDFGKRNAWLLIGLAVSLQEQLWVIALLFIAYSFNNYGWKKGALDFLGAAAVFLLINGYFLLSGGAYAYVSNFTSLTSGLFPNSYSPIGYLLINVYDFSTISFNYLFGLSILLSILLSLYANDKKVILLISIMPFMFLGHGAQIYYIVPIALFAILSEVELKENRMGYIQNRLRKTAAPALALSILAFIVVTAAVVYLGHSSYESNFGISTTGQSISAFNSTDLVYNSVVASSLQKHESVSLLLELDVGGSDSYFGLFNDSIIRNSSKCGFPCAVNVNNIAFEGKGTYNLTAFIPSNITAPAYISAILYNSSYFYKSAPVLYK